MKGKIRFLAWTIGLLGGLFFLARRATGRVKMIGYEKRKIAPSEEGLLVIFPHHSMTETIELPFLWFPWYLFDLRFVPFSTPDKKYYDSARYRFYRDVAIPVERGKRKEEVRFLDRVEEALNQGKIVILAPAGGRVFKGTEFKVINNGQIEVRRISAEQSFDDLNKEFNGRIIRRFKKGVGRIVQRTKAKVLQIWDEGGEKAIPNRVFLPYFPFWPLLKFWKETKYIIGEPFSPKRDIPRAEIIEILEDNLLRLGDQ